MVWKISLESTKDPEQGNVHKLEFLNERTQGSDLRVPLESDPFEIWPTVTQKVKKMQEKLVVMPPNQQPSTQITFHITVCQCMAAVLTDLVQGLKQKKNKRKCTSMAAPILGQGGRQHHSKHTRNFKTDIHYYSLCPHAKIIDDGPT